MTTTTGVDQGKMRNLAISAASHAYSPYSKVKVGCAIFANNQYFSGCNVENCSYGATICAERVAIAHGVSQGVRKIDAVYVYTLQGWTPCGICRQVIAEFATEQTLIIIGDEHSTLATHTVESILPLAFLPLDLKT